MKTLHKRCAGVDVHKTEVVVCLRLVTDGKVEREVRRFPTTTHGLLELAEWLESARCTHVAMEATGVYWKPVWHILDGRFALILANAAHVKTVPGRKSDVNDASWLADLLAHGLIRPSFVPPAAIQELRDLTRTRKQLTRKIAQHSHHIQEATLVLRMKYRGDERTSELPLTQDMIRQLAFEAQFRNMSIGELVGELLMAMMKRSLFQHVLDEPNSKQP
jgi:transposase